MMPLASSHDIITELARTGAKQILAAALEQEVSEYIEQYAKNRDEHGHQQVVRNGHYKDAPANDAKTSVTKEKNAA